MTSTGALSSHDSIDTVIGRALIGRAAGDEDPAGAVAVDERLDLVAGPERLKAAGDAGLDDPTGIVGVNAAVSAAFQLGRHRRLSSA